MGFDLSDYNTVPERIVEFREKHPEGSLQSEIILPEWLAQGLVVVKAYAYRSPDDPKPGMGLAWEPVPGKTPYTKDSELMNAETSAWGRAIIAALASDAKKIASREEVKSRQVEHGAPAPAPVRQEEAGGEPQVGRTPSAEPPAPSTGDFWTDFAKEAGFPKAVLLKRVRAHPEGKSIQSLDGLDPAHPAAKEVIEWAEATAQQVAV